MGIVPSVTYINVIQGTLDSVLGTVHSGHHAGLPFLFVQFVTDTIFKELIKIEFPVSTATTTTSESPHCPLSCEEQNALRYVAGYVCRKVRTKLETSSLPNKDEMILCIMEMSGDEEGDGGTETWTNLVDRGGLWHMNDQTYRLFVAMEYSICQRLTMATASKQEEGARSHLIEAIMACDDVKFQWCSGG